MFNPENAAGTVQFISKLAVQKMSGKTMKKILTALLYSKPNSQN